MGERTKSVILDKPWFSLREAVAYLSLSERKILDLAAEGRFGRHKLGTHERSRVLLKKAEIDRYVESCREPITAT